MIQVTTKRFTLAEYDRLIELGFLTEDDRVELIRGLVQLVEPSLSKAYIMLHSALSRSRKFQLSY